MKKILSALLISIFIFLLPIKSIATPADTCLECIVEPAERLSTRWQFVVDTSESTKDIFANVHAAFVDALKFPTDELKFSVITFNNRGMEAKWPELDNKMRPISENHLMNEFCLNELTAANRFIRTHCGVLSYGGPALETAIKQPIKNLTIILITDGGFTEVTMYGGKHWERITSVIDSSQEWRRNNNFNPALISVIGIENINYHAGNKPSDGECQSFLRSIGEQWHGGYFLVRQ